MICGNSAARIASRRCSRISASGHSNAVTGTVSVTALTPEANPLTAAPDPVLTWAVPRTVQVQPRTVELPDTVKSTEDCAADGWGASTPSVIAALAAMRMNPRTVTAALIVRTRTGSGAS